MKVQGLAELVKQANRMQQKVQKRKEELKTERFSASSGNEKVRAVASGEYKIVELQVDPKLMKDEGLEMVQDLIIAAVNASLQKAHAHTEAELEKITGGFSIPGLG